MRVEAKWSGQLKDAIPDDQGSPMYGGVGWLVEVTADGYRLELGSGQQAVPRRAGETFKIDRQEATAVKLKLRELPGSPDWLRHDAPEMIVYLATQRD